jgi:organic radical activating enzyme
MHELNYCEFYITNVCNLNCTNCNRYNNFAFAGHDTWKLHEKTYEQWSKIISSRRIGILGGEPLLNPDFFNWLSGITRLWPQADIDIITNGTQLSRWPNLYEELLTHRDKVNVKVNWHNETELDQLFGSLEQFLVGPIIKKTVIPINVYVWRECYQAVKDPTWPECPTPSDFKNLSPSIQTECIDIHGLDSKSWTDVTDKYILWTDANGIKIKIRYAWHFHSSALKLDSVTGKLSLHNSDPEKAMAVCDFKTCHHFIAGKLYKCGPVGILPSFIDQFHVDISDSDQQLLRSYEPACNDWSEDKLQKFIKDLVDAKPIAQCKFCPESYVFKKFNSGTKKIKLVKKI